MIINTARKGQTSIILIIVTMVTILGIGASSATRSKVNLREAVNSTQSVQALSCAESGAEIALADSDVNDNTELASEKNASATLSNCNYSYTIKNYPQGDKQVLIPNIQENSAHQLVHDGGDDDIDIKFKPVSSNSKASLAIYMYKDNEVIRRFINCGTSKPSSDFEQLSPSGGVCTLSNLNIEDVKVLRLRPLYSDMEIVVEDYPTKTGYLIESEGMAGSVSRQVSVYRFYSQLPDGFDEAVIDY